MLSRQRISQIKQSGYTLIELLVVVSIIVLLSYLVVTGYLRSQNQYSVSVAVQQFSADLRRVQNMALVGKMQVDEAPKGYGLYVLSTTQYIIYYNIDPNAKKRVGGGASIDMGTTLLPAGVSFNAAGDDIYFTSPNPSTYINNVNNGSKVFTLSQGSHSKTVTVDVGGRIDTH